jgi:hypothetical protein
MEKDDTTVEGGLFEDEDLLDFDLDDLESVDGPEFEEDNEIIELVDLVENVGRHAPDLDETAGEIGVLLDEDGDSPEAGGGPEGDSAPDDFEGILSDVDVDDAVAEIDMSEVALELDMDAGEPSTIREEVTAGTEGPPAEEPAEGGEGIGPDEFQEMLEFPEEASGPMPGEDETAREPTPEPDAVPEPLPAYTGDGEIHAPPGPRAEVMEAPGERIEETVRTAVEETFRREMPQLVREAVERAIRGYMADTAERVIRESVTGTAERIIRETIDALKSGLDADEK